MRTLAIDHGIESRLFLGYVSQTDFTRQYTPSQLLEKYGVIVQDLRSDFHADLFPIFTATINAILSWASEDAADDFDDLLEFIAEQGAFKAGSMIALAAQLPSLIGDLPDCVWAGAADVGIPECSIDADGFVYLDIIRPDDLPTFDFNQE